MRCFVAIRLSDRANQELGRVIEELRRVGADVRWVPEANLHLTLKFLGEVSDSEIAPVHEALRQVSGGPLCLTVTGLGSFPPQRRPKSRRGGAGLHRGQLIRRKGSADSWFRTGR